MAALFAGFIDGPMARQRPAPFLCNGFLPGSYTTSGHVVRGLAALSMSAGWNSESIKLANAACCVDSAMGERQWLPPLDLEYSDDMRNELAQIVGGLSVALAQSFLVIDPRVKHPNTGHWERAFQLFNLLL